MISHSNPLPPLVIIPLEQFAGESDVPCYEELGTREAMELNEGMGGRHTFGLNTRPAGRASDLEEAADRMLDEAYDRLLKSP
jgi:hypothetical protein